MPVRVRKTLPMPPTYCLRCETAELTVLPESNDRITFYECASCGRHYAQQPGRGLCDRWPGPIGLVLYGIQFEPQPQEHFQRVAQDVFETKSRGEIARMIEEIEMELREPRQHVRDILDLPHGEEQLRAFLRLVVDYWKASL
jgi:hypothetical protein